MPTNKVTYKFYVNGTEFFPHYGTDLSIETEKESEQQYYRRKLSGDLTFVGAEFEYIDSQAFDTEFLVLIETYINGIKDAAQDWNGRFFKADGLWDYDTQKVKVAVETKDQYTEFLAKYDKEYDLIKIATARTPLKFDSRPLIQMYKPNDSLVACFVGGTYWEQPVTETKEAFELDEYSFSLLNTVYSVILTETSSASVDVSGGYVFNETVRISEDANTYEEESYLLSAEGNGYWLVFYAKYEDQGQGYTSTDFYYYVIEQGASDPDNGLYSSDGAASYLHLEANRVGVTGSYTAATDTQSQQTIYARWVCDSDTINGQSTTDILDSDFVTENRNYSKVISFEDAGGVTKPPTAASSRGSETPTPWGTRPDGTYYTVPIEGDKYFPIGRNTWGNVSLWFYYTQEVYDVEATGRLQRSTNETMKVSSALESLLSEMNVGVTHVQNSAYSEFLYAATNPISGEAIARLMLTPKSNVTAGNYDQPAQKSPLTVKRVLDALAQTLKLYWYIDSAGKLVIEHIHWFNNGGSYSTSPTIGVDLTALYEATNRKPWSYAVNQIKYEKQELPERINFTWSDKVTEVFDGTGIDVISGYVEPGSEENNQINYFTSDIDFMRLSPEDINPDGFALFYAHLPGTEWVLPYEELTFDGYTAYVQNAWLSMVYALPTFHLYDAPAPSLEVNGEAETAITTKKIKSQTVRFPSVSEVDITKLVKTSIGNGRIEKIKLNLSSRMNEIELRYDAE